MKLLKELFKEKPWWEKSKEEIDYELKTIRWIVKGLFVVGFLMSFYMMINGLIIHN